MASTELRQPSILIKIISSLSHLHDTAQLQGTSQTDWSCQLTDDNRQKLRVTMLTLHFLFPHELLPALDLLDRKLVNHFPVPPLTASCSADQSFRDSGVFHIQSASATIDKTAKSGKFRRAFNQTGMFYEVRLDSWNCTCPAFAYSAFGEQDDETDGEVVEEQVENEWDDTAEIAAIGGEAMPPDSWAFGGLLTNDVSSVPICKHILAAAIGQVAPVLFPGGVRTSTPAAEEVAGWAGGWSE